MADPDSMNRQQDREDSSTPRSSPGEHPVSETPKDVAPDQAAARDLLERDLRSNDVYELQEALLDEGVEETFPASDPVAVSGLEDLKRRMARLRAAGNRP